MFWGLIMEPNKRYTQVVDKTFHVSMACLDAKGVIDDTPVQVMLCYENRKYVICNLKQSTNLQTPLDLNFEAGTKITFVSNGNSNVHLTGYHILNMEVDEEEDEEDGWSEQEMEDSINKGTKKRKNTSPIGSGLEKKGKTELLLNNINDEDDDDEDDEDFMHNLEEDSSEDEEASDEEIDEEDLTHSEDFEEGEEDETIEPEEKPEQVEKPKEKKNKKQNKNQEKQINGKDSSEKSKKVETELKKKEDTKGQKRTVAGGVQIEDLKVGTGQQAKKGQMVGVYYVGRLKNGKKFDSVNSGKAFKFRLGSSEVIKGWDIGVNGMKIGGKRRITVPSALGYGAKGYPPVIPGNSTLIFEIELKSVN